MLRRQLDYGFDEQAARDLFDEGMAKNACSDTGNSPSDQPAFEGRVVLVPSALCDLECYVKDDVRKRLKETILSLPEKSGTAACVRIPGRDGWVLREGPFRIVFRVDHNSKRFVIFGIACWAANPSFKIWRYLDQSKAEDLVRTRELYFRRLDLLQDEYEGTPTLGGYLDYEAAHRTVFPADTAIQDNLFDARKRSTFACCWRMDPHESWLMWKQYCLGNGGFALQTTSRKLDHLHVLLRQKYDVHCREVSYIQHHVDEPRMEGLGDEAFDKAVWFSDEREVRLVRFRDDYFKVTHEALKDNPKLIPDCDRIECNDLAFVERIVINPFATEAQKAALIGLIEQEQPSLLPKISDSMILQTPAGVC